MGNNTWRHIHSEDISLVAYQSLVPVDADKVLDVANYEDDDNKIGTHKIHKYNASQKRTQALKL